MRHFAVGRSRIRIGGLGPNTAYVATVTAFDAEGNPSEPSAPVEILTGSSNREAVLTIR